MNGYDAVVRAERCDLSVSAKKKPVNFYAWHSLQMNIFVSKVIAVPGTGIYMSLQIQRIWTID